MEWLHMAQHTACTMQDYAAVMTMFKQEMSGEPVGWLLFGRVRTSVSWPRLNSRLILGWVSNDMFCFEAQWRFSTKMGVG